MKYKQITLKEKKEKFTDFEPQFTVGSPGRINLIGEHTDYNNGFVLPTAIDKTIRLQFATNSTEFDCNIYSKTYDKSFSFDLRKISRSQNQWENYIIGVVHELQKREKKLKGFDCIITSDLPVGAGISSSAALECGIAFGLNELFDLGLERRAMAELSRDAEHNFVGTKCGIMDQYASILSKEDHFILLDCASLEAEYIPAEMNDYAILLLNTGVSHSLADSEYNTRRAECEAAVAQLQKSFSEISSLRDVTPEILLASKNLLSEVLFKRASFVVEENERVLKAVAALKENDKYNLGQLMFSSHRGLEEKYEVSCRELDFLVDFAERSGSVTGSRMMGGGFGGCTINLLKEEEVGNFVTSASEAYYREFGIDLQEIIVSPEAGTHLITS